MSTAAVRAWVPHLVCLGLLLGELGAWLAVHRSGAEIEAAWRDGATTRERLDGLFVLLNRGTLDPAQYGLPFVRDLLAEEDDLVKEVAFTNEVCKFLEPDYQMKMYLEKLPAGQDDCHRWRAFLLFCRKVGGGITGAGLRVIRQELVWFYDAVHERPLPMKEIQVHLEERGIEIGRRLAR